MAAKSKTPRPPLDAPLVIVGTRQEARERIEEQIRRGSTIAKTEIRSQHDLAEARAQMAKWEKFTEELLKTLFTNGSLAQEFTQYWGGVFFAEQPFPEVVAEFRSDVIVYVRRLESIVERLELWPERPTPPLSQTVGQAKADRSNKVFVVHGHDEARRETVSRFLSKLGLQPIVLHEQANQGKTVIEKIEANSDVAFAVVLMTADDLGASQTAPDSLQPRARQNVVLELGYFVGCIGRERVCALYEDGVELPSDFSGVVYLSLRGSWQFDLAKELRAAGFSIDLNRL